MGDSCCWLTLFGVCVCVCVCVWTIAWAPPLSGRWKMDVSVNECDNFFILCVALYSLISWHSNATSHANLMVWKESHGFWWLLSSTNILAAIHSHLLLHWLHFHRYRSFFFLALILSWYKNCFNLLISIISSPFSALLCFLIDAFHHSFFHFNLFMFFVFFLFFFFLCCL